MASDFFYPPSKNAVQKTLSAQLLSTATTGDAITFADVDGLQNKPGVLVINRVDSNGDATPSSREYISYSGTSGNTVLIATRNVDSSASAKTHAVGSVVEFIPDVVWAQRMIDQFKVEHDADGTHGAITPTSVAIAGSTALTGNASASDVITGTSDALVVTPLASAPLLNSSIYRQAIINGNFDVWQRGTSFTPTDAVGIYTADRWRHYHADDGGTLPTITVTRQLQTSGDISGSYYFHRIAVNGAGTSLGANAIGELAQYIEHGTRFLCGASKKVTVSFWARSSIANKKIGITAQQYYGTGGSPSATENINGENWTLTSSWTKYTHTFTTNTLSGKTFGTDNNDIFIIGLWCAWGSNATRYDRVGGSGAESYVGSGNIDIAQVQLCAGDVALPFMPKSFDEELGASQRYYQSSEYGGLSGFDGALSALAVTAATLHPGIKFIREMRAIPTVSFYSCAATPAINKISPANAQTELAISPNMSGQVSTKGTSRYLDTSAPLSAGTWYWFNWTADAEL